jgi:hypothetical protein
VAVFSLTFGTVAEGFSLYLTRIVMISKKPRKGNSVKIVAAFRHYRTGELIVAADYGHKGFPIRSPKRKPK